MNGNFVNDEFNSIYNLYFTENVSLSQEWEIYIHKHIFDSV